MEKIIVDCSTDFSQQQSQFQNFLFQRYIKISFDQQVINSS